MKKNILLIVISLFSITLSQAQEILKINTAKSTLKWYGEYTFFFNGHDGAISFKDGHFIKTNDKITGGEFIIDMNSITNADIKTEDANTSLVNHLKDQDFFDVKNFPLSKLVITNVSYHDGTSMQIDANLIIKGITESIRFQAEVDYKKEQMTTKFKIDRKRWGVNYESKMKNSAISDAIGFEVKLSL